MHICKVECCCWENVLKIELHSTSLCFKEHTNNWVSFWSTLGLTCPAERNIHDRFSLDL